MDRLIALIYEDNYALLLDEESRFSQCYRSLADKTGASLADLRYCITELLIRFEKATQDLLDTDYSSLTEDDIDTQLNSIESKRYGLIRTLEHIDNYELAQLTTSLSRI